MIFEVSSLAKTFKSDLLKSPYRVFDELSFKLESGKITGFLGLNGSGKTTLIKMILGLISSDSGGVTWSPSLDFKKLGFLPERPVFFPNMTGEEFILYMGQLNGLSNTEIKEFIAQEKKLIGLDFDLDKKIKEMSKGMVQKVGFAASYVNQPSIIILDEPLSGLDPVSRRQFKDRILKLNRDGASVFFSSHIISDVEEICDNLLIISGGQKIYDGKIIDLENEYQTDSFWIETKMKINESIAAEEQSDNNFKYSNSVKSDVIQTVLNSGEPIISLRPDIVDLETIILGLSKK